MQVFGADLLNDRSLERIFLELCGYVGIKPFECVGTAEEVRAALKRTSSYYGENNIPYLLELYLNKADGTTTEDAYNFDKILKNRSDDNLLNTKFKSRLLENL